MLVLCLTLVASLWNGACAFACAASPMAPEMSHLGTGSSKHEANTSGMAMDGNHDCCPPAGTTAEAAPLQPSVCSDLQALAWKTVDDASVHTVADSPADQPQPSFFGASADLSVLRIRDRRWPPGSSRASWLSPTGFTPKITQILV